LRAVVLQSLMRRVRGIVRGAVRVSKPLIPWSLGGIWLGRSASFDSWSKVVDTVDTRSRACKCYGPTIFVHWYSRRENGESNPKRLHVKGQTLPSKSHSPSAFLLSTHREPHRGQEWVVVCYQRVDLS
jgi:hypothetical protein